MCVSRVVPILVLFVLLAGVQVSLLPGQAYAQLEGKDGRGPYVGCCRMGTCYWWCGCGCSRQVEACVGELMGRDKFTLKPKHSGPAEITAEEDILKQLFDLRKKGKTLCGNFALKLVGNVNNIIKLQCTTFELDGPISKEVEDRTREFEDAISAMPEQKSTSNSMNK